ncbi:MAG TPA: OsmC family peroxiredoxin [Saprospiraceae bacterium]|nr:OsmC family peroxiredoxin [Saprospiraceae bacterium]
MAVDKVTATWIEDLVFDSQIGENTIRVQGSVAKGPRQGPGPKALLLSSLTGCTGMDVVSLMDKMRVQYDGFEVIAEAELTDEHPKNYKSIQLTYIVKGPKAKEKADKVKKSVDLSLDRYCGVAYMLRKHCPITYEIQYQD